MDDERNEFTRTSLGKEMHASLPFSPDSVVTMVISPDNSYILMGINRLY